MIITLTGSSRFKSAFDIANMHYTMAGHVVFSLSCFGHFDYPDGAKYLTGDADIENKNKQILDEGHLKKIDMSDVLVVVNVGDYLGEGTIREIAYARSKGIRVVNFIVDLK